MKTAEYLKQLEDEVQSLLNGDVFSKCDYSTYDSLTENFGELFREIDEQRKIIEQQQFVLDGIDETMAHIGVDMSTKGDFSASDIIPNAFVGFLGKTEDGKAELAKKEIVKVFDINKTMEGGNK